MNLSITPSSWPGTSAVCIEDLIAALFGKILEDRANDIARYDLETARLQEAWSRPGRPMTQEQMQTIQDRIQHSQEMKNERSELFKMVLYWLEALRKTAAGVFGDE